MAMREEEDEQEVSMMAAEWDEEAAVSTLVAPTWRKQHAAIAVLAVCLVAYVCAELAPRGVLPSKVSRGVLEGSVTLASIKHNGSKDDTATVKYSDAALVEDESLRAKAAAEEKSKPAAAKIDDTDSSAQIMEDVNLADVTNPAEAQKQLDIIMQAAAQAGGLPAAQSLNIFRDKPLSPNMTAAQTKAAAEMSNTIFKASAKNLEQQAADLMRRTKAHTAASLADTRERTERDQKCLNTKEDCLNGCQPGVETWMPCVANCFDAYIACSHSLNTPAPTPYVPATPQPTVAGLPGGFYVAEVKPHYQCSAEARGDRVRDYVDALVSKEYGIITLIQFEFTFAEPEGYIAFGASCTTKYSDSVVVLVNENKFSLISGLGDTVVGNYTDMPFLTTGTQLNGSMCVADPASQGERAWTGAVLREKDSGIEFCAVSATFPHCRGRWRPEFLSDIEQGCGARPLLIIADTNAACESEGTHASKEESMEFIGKNHSANWGTCSDPAIADPQPTCCHDLTQGQPEARYWYDRIALCGGGVVDQFQVTGDFPCGTNEEHKFISAVVHLNPPSPHSADDLKDGSSHTSSKLQSKSSQISVRK